MFKNLDIVYLKEKVEEYLDTLDSDYKDEWWTTQQNIAGEQLFAFIEWLDSNP